MKKLLTLTLMLLCLGTFAEARQVVTFKNGSIVRGEILEYKPKKEITIQTDNGSVLVYNSKDIVSIDTDYRYDYDYDDDEYYEYSANGKKLKKNLAHKGYKGFVFVDPVATTHYGYSLGVYTTHGYQINHSTFIGAGIGMLYTHNDSGFIAPIYAAIKGNVGRGFIQFAYGARVGYAIANDIYKNRVVSSDKMIDGFIYLNFNAGCRIPISSRFALRIIPQVEMYAGTPLNYNLGIGLGFEF